MNDALEVVVTKMKIMAQLTMEVGLPSQWLAVQADVELMEQFPGAPLTWPSSSSSLRVIQQDQGFQVRFDWQPSGILPSWLYGKWHLGVVFEEQGSGEGIPALNYATPVGLMGAGPFTYTFPATSIPVTPGAPGARMIRATATMVWYSASNQPSAIAGFCDLGLFQMLPVT